MFADAVSVSRILLAYPLYHALMEDNTLISICLIIWMILSDLIDGGIARYYGGSIYGKWLDPIADALAVFASMMALCHLQLISYVWVFFWLFRYIFFMWIACWVVYTKGYYISSGVWNKVSICFLVIFLCSIWYGHAVSYVLGAVVATTQIISMIETVFKVYRHKKF